MHLGFQEGWILPGSPHTFPSLEHPETTYRSLLPLIEMFKY